MAAYRFISETGHRRALAMVLAFAITHYSVKFAGLDVEVVDQALYLILAIIGAYMESASAPAVAK